MFARAWLATAVALPLLLNPTPSPEESLSRQENFSGEAVAAVAVRPVLGPAVRRFDPPETRYGAGHRGVDLAAAAGQPVVAALGGTVTFAGPVAGVSWITVGHGGGLETTYGPVEPRLVAAGDVVGPGSVLGLVAAGASHLDWGARLDGAYIDPLGLLGRWGTYLTTADDVGLPALGGPAAVAAVPGAVPGRLAWPAVGPMTSGFGPRIHPVTGGRRLHAGVDIAAPAGAPVRAAAAGTVTLAGTLGGYGRTVTIDHGGRVSTLYAHQTTTSVQVGERVQTGQLVGRVGSTGVSTGPHLHFEVSVAGAPSDPLGWLRR
jgi:murein DD-endopeptidase MepM/ murein hydrolase activator NlpD